MGSLSDDRIHNLTVRLLNFKRSEVRFVFHCIIDELGENLMLLSDVLVLYLKHFSQLVKRSFDTLRRHDLTRLRVFLKRLDV